MSHIVESCPLNKLADDGLLQLSSADNNAITWIAWLRYLTRRYDSAICCSKMWRDAFLSEAHYEADKMLEKFAWKVRCSTAGVCMFTRWRMEQTMNHRCVFYFVILHSMSMNSLRLCLRLYSVDCCIAANHWVSMQQDREALTCSNQ